MDVHDNSHHVRFVQSSRDALAHHRGLNSTIDALASFATNLGDETSKRELNKHTQALKEHAVGFSEFLSRHVPARYYNENRAEESSTTAGKVFAVPELLEHILCFSDLRDILAVCGVNHALRAIVEASPNLQVKLCYKPIDASKGTDIERTTAFDMRTAVARRSSRSDWRDLKIWVETDIMGLPGNEWQNVIVHFGYIATVDDLPKIGSAWQRMFICQPPVEEMSVRWHCSLHPRGFRNRSKVYSKTGLTVGDLHAKAVEIMGDGTTCTACKGGEPIEDWDTRGTGNSEIRIKFETPVKGKPTSWNT